jgi:hypothetical protein
MYSSRALIDTLTGTPRPTSAIVTPDSTSVTTYNFFQGLTEPDSDSDDKDDLHGIEQATIMSSESSKKGYPDLKEHLTTESVEPFSGKINYAVVVIFREELGTALSKFTSERHEGGHAWMVDKLATYRDRLGDDTLDIPSPPKKPKAPTSLDKIAWSKFFIERDEHNQYTHWKNEGFKAIERRFPSSLTALKTTIGALPLTLTLRKALDHVEGQVSKEVDRREAYCKIQTSLTARKYVPVVEGPVEFLKEMEHDKHYIDLLDVNAPVSYDVLIVHCQNAFRHSGIPKTEMRKVDAKWKTKDETHKADADYKDTQWRRFKEFYTDEIKDLNADGITNHRANSLLESRVDELQTQLKTQFDEIGLLNSNQEHFEHALRTVHDVPSVVGTHVSSALSASGNQQQLQELIAREVQRILGGIGQVPQGNDDVTTAAYDQSSVYAPTFRTRATTNSGTNPHSGRGRGPQRDSGAGTWRQWNKWCWTHGVNLRHDSAGCEHQRSGHKTEATKNNPMGGNTRRDNLWMKWCSPVDHRPYDNPE